LIETCQDPLQIKAAVNGAKRARAAAGKDIPIIVRVTVETTGTLLVGADIAPRRRSSMALRRADSSGSTARPARARWPSMSNGSATKLAGADLRSSPNAGLPELIDGHTHYPLTPKELAQMASSALCSRTGST